jgi:hypothetical protein
LPQTTAGVDVKLPLRIAVVNAADGETVRRGQGRRVATFLILVNRNAVSRGAISREAQVREAEEHRRTSEGSGVTTDWKLVVNWRTKKTFVGGAGLQILRSALP